MRMGGTSGSCSTSRRIRASSSSLHAAKSLPDSRSLSLTAARALVSSSSRSSSARAPGVALVPRGLVLDDSPDRCGSPGLRLAGGRRRRRGGCAAVPAEVGHVDHALEHLAEDRVVGLGLVAGREQRDAAEPVQLVDGGGAGYRDGRPEPGRALGGDGDAGGVQEVAETGHDPRVQPVIGEDARVDAAHPCARIRRPRPRRGPRHGRRPGPRGTSAPIRGSCRPTRHRGRGCPAASPR